MKPIRVFYAFLALVGLLGTWKYNIDFMRETGGMDLVAFFKSGFVSSASSSLSIDFWVSFFAGFTFLVTEATRLRMKRWWIYVLLLAIAWAVALPLFLLARDRALDEKS